MEASWLVQSIYKSPVHNCYCSEERIVITCLDFESEFMIIDFPLFCEFSQLRIQSFIFTVVQNLIDNHVVLAYDFTLYSLIRKLKYHRLDVTIIVCRYTGINNANFVIQQIVSRIFFTANKCKIWCIKVCQT